MLTNEADGCLNNQTIIYHLIVKKVNLNFLEKILNLTCEK